MLLRAGGLCWVMGFPTQPLGALRESSWISFGRYDALFRDETGGGESALFPALPAESDLCSSTRPSEGEWRPRTLPKILICACHGKT
jgi:hypothetical protein